MFILKWRSNQEREAPTLAYFDVCFPSFHRHYNYYLQQINVTLLMCHVPVTRICTNNHSICKYHTRAIPSISGVIVANKIQSSIAKTLRLAVASHVARSFWPIKVPSILTVRFNFVMTLAPVRQQNSLCQVRLTFINLVSIEMI